MPVWGIFIFFGSPKKMKQKKARGTVIREKALDWQVFCSAVRYRGRPFRLSALHLLIEFGAHAHFPLQKTAGLFPSFPMPPFFRLGFLIDLEEASSIPVKTHLCKGREAERVPCGHLPEG